MWHRHLTPLFPTVEACNRPALGRSGPRASPCLPPPPAQQELPLSLDPRVARLPLLRRILPARDQGRRSSPPSATSTQASAAPLSLPPLTSLSLCCSAAMASMVLRSRCRQVPPPPDPAGIVPAPPDLPSPPPDQTPPCSSPSPERPPCRRSSSAMQGGRGSARCR
nr:classical arabinogalactan protein 9-like [Aegilops tauschii subsp. strangulata]